MRICLYYKSNKSKHRGNSIYNLGLRKVNPKNKLNRIILKSYHCWSLNLVSQQA